MLFELDLMARFTFVSKRGNLGQTARQRTRHLLLRNVSHDNGIAYTTVVAATDRTPLPLFQKKKI
jgi:hypothetical protein